MMEPRRAVRKALRSLGRKPLVIPGAPNKLSDVSGKYLTLRPVQTAMFGTLLTRAIEGLPAQAPTN